MCVWQASLPVHAYIGYEQLDDPKSESRKIVTLSEGDGGEDTTRGMIYQSVYSPILDVIRWRPRSTR